MRQTVDYVPADHPLRPIREILDRALREMDLLFQSIYAERGRESVRPERLLRGLVLQALYGIRSERLLCEQLGLQPALPLVRGAEHGGGAVGSQHLPRTATG